MGPRFNPITPIMCRCGEVFRRHSKSIGEDHSCGACSGKLEFLGKEDAQGNIVPPRPPTAYQKFVKEITPRLNVSFLTPKLCKNLQSFLSQRSEHA